MQSLDNRVYVPINRSFKNLCLFERHPDHVKAKSVDALEDTKEEVRGIMRKSAVLNRKTRIFAINQQEMLVQTFNTIGALLLP